MEDKTKILIVDDEPDVLRILEKRLTGNGYQVVSADSGYRALQMARKERPDLIILDIDMPDIDGGEVAARLKEEEATKHIPVIFLSCLVTPREMAEGIAGRMVKLFQRDESGRRPIYGGMEKFQQDPHWRDYLLFNEYFHGDNGAGLGANHQTGWTGLVANLIDEWRR